MIRRIFLVLFTGLVAVVLFLGYQKLEEQRKLQVNLYASVPFTSYAVFEISNPIEQWNEITSNNIIWEEMLYFPVFQEFQQDLIDLDSNLHSNSKTLGTKSMVVSFSELNDGSHAYAIHTSISDKLPNKKQFLGNLVNLPVTKLSEELFEITIGTKKMGFWMKDHLLVFSSNFQYLHLISSELNPEQNILNDSTFVSVKNTSAKNAKIRSFIDLTQVIGANSHLAHTNYIATLKNQDPIGSWIELDLEAKPDEISGTGIIVADSSKNDWLSLFENQESVTSKVYDLIPNSTAFMLQFGFSNYPRLREKFAIRESKKIGSDFDYYINKWDTLYDIDITNDFLNWVDNEIAVVVVEPEQSDFSEDIMIWVGAGDASTLFSRLKNIALQVDNENGDEFYSLDYKSYEIIKLNIPDFLEQSLGMNLNMINNNYFTQIGNYVVFSNSPSVLQWNINKINRKKVLQNDIHFQSYQNRVSDQSNVTLYSNIARSTEIYKSWFNSDIQSLLLNDEDWFKKFQVFSIQASYERDSLYFTTAYIKYNPVYKKESRSLWELPLYANSTFKPEIVKNHYTDANEIFVQDTANNVYLITNKGKMLWSKKIDGKIISDVKQIDVFKNGKLQLAFNTQNSIYILDRNGQNLDKFPVALESPATTAMSVFDYENTQDYRFVVPVESGEVLNYGINGNKTRGWKYAKKKNPISQPIQHINIKGKDYLIGFYLDGTVKALDRKGLIRINLKSKINFPIISKLHLQKGSSLSNSYLLGVTENSEVVKISLTDKKTRLFKVSKNNIQFIDYADVDRNGSIEIIVTDSISVSAFSTDNTKVMDVPLKIPTNYNPNMYRFGGSSFIGYSNQNLNEVYLISLTGENYKGFPYNGYSPFTIRDINNDGRLNVLTTTETGSLVVYTIEP